MTKQLQKMADDLAKALSAAAKDAEKLAEAKEALEKSPAYKACEKIQEKMEQSQSEAEGLKESLLEEMKKTKEKNVESGEYKIHTSEKINVAIDSEEKLFLWLKKKKIYDQYVVTEPSIDKKALNKFIMGLSNDRQLPKADECGVELVPNVFIVVKTAKDE